NRLASALSVDFETAATSTETTPTLTPEFEAGAAESTIFQQKDGRPLPCILRPTSQPSSTSNKETTLPDMRESFACIYASGAVAKLPVTLTNNSNRPFLFCGYSDIPDYPGVTTLGHS
ncbi:hypothetical protein ARMGADRAFT_1133644, partial [Armillaria gallica]